MKLKKKSISAEYGKKENQKFSDLDRKNTRMLLTA
jgi:hypothetical protein